MNRLAFFSAGCLWILASCAPKISSNISKNYGPLDYREEVRVFAINEQTPENSEEIGIVKIGDSGFTIKCDWETVIEKAKIEARKNGGNAIKILEHTPPNMGSSCHRITAAILRVESFENMPVAIDSTLINADFALLHIYRYGFYGALISYNLHLDDSAICRVTNNFKKTIKIRKEGMHTLWAKTESKEELPINIQLGNSYFIRCSVGMGAFVGRPILELVDNQTGRHEFKAIKIKKSDRRDIIELNDGREIECIINNEDQDQLYITIFRDNRSIKTQISKANVAKIQRSEDINL